MNHAKTARSSCLCVNYLFRIKRIKMNSILCPKLINSSQNLLETPLRISAQLQPKECYYYINIVNSIISFMKVPYLIQYYQTIGTQNENTWNGVIGDLVNNQSDLGVGPFSMTLQRFDLMKLSAPLGYGSPIAILSGRIPANINRNNFFEAFQPIIWISIILTIISMALIDTLIYSNEVRNSFNIQIILRKVYLYSFSLLAQSLNISIEFVVLNICYLWNVFNYYSFNHSIFKSDILSDLLFDPIIIVDTMSDLAKLSELRNITIYSQKDMLSWQLIAQSTDESFKKVSQMEPNSENFDLVQMKCVLSGKGVWISYSNLLEPFVQSNKNLGFHMSKDTYFGSSLVLFYSKYLNQKLIDRIDFVAFILYESGLQNYWINCRRKTQTDLYLNNDDKGRHTIDLDSITLLLQVCFILYLFAICIILFEILHNWFRFTWCN